MRRQELERLVQAPLCFLVLTADGRLVRLAHTAHRALDDARLGLGALGLEDRDSRLLTRRARSFVALAGELAQPLDLALDCAKDRCLGGRRLAPGEELSATVTVFAESAYGVRVSAERPPVTPFTVQVKVDGVVAGELNYRVDSNGGATTRVQTVNLTRGAHTIAVVNGSEPIDLYSVTVAQELVPPTPDQRALHYRLLGIEAGQAPLDPRAAVERFALVHADRLILTKLDEAEGLGGLLAVIGQADRPVSYLTTGQAVPDDLEPADRRRLARLILGDDTVIV